jgi:HAD superfamily hydrolase (TIGR01509 family)
MIKALIFDFDGVILETEEPQYLAWLEVYQSFDVPLSLKEYGKLIGSADIFFDPYLNLEEAVGRKINWEELDKKRQKNELERILEKEPQPGVVEYLRGARQLGMKTAIASSSGRPWVEGHLERLNLLDYFDCLLTREDVNKTKPDPELFLTAAGNLGVKPDEAIIFEDSPNGVLAANRAEIFCVAIPTVITSQLILGSPDLRLSSLTDLSLPALLERVSKIKGNGWGKIL